jgi:hypothetical protein
MEGISLYKMLVASQWTAQHNDPENNALVIVSFVLLYVAGLHLFVLGSFRNPLI